MCVCVCVCVCEHVCACSVVSDSLRPHGLYVVRQAPLSIGFSRQEYWSGLPFPTPGDLPDPGFEPKYSMAPALMGRFFTTEPPRVGLATLFFFFFANFQFNTLSTAHEKTRRGNVKRCRYCGKQYSGFSKNSIYNYHMIQQLSF